MEYGRPEDTDKLVLRGRHIDYFAFCILQGIDFRESINRFDSAIGLLLGWADYNTIAHEAFKLRYSEQYRGKGSYLPFTNPIYLLKKERALAPIDLDDLE